MKNFLVLEKSKLCSVDNFNSLYEYGTQIMKSVNIVFI